MRRFITGLVGLVSVFGAVSQAFAASQQFVGPYYESFTDIRTCSNISTCAISFPAIPTGKTLLMKKISCSVAAVQVPIITYFGPSSNSLGFPIKRARFSGTLSDTIYGGYHYSIYESTTEILMGPGKFPTAYFVFPSGNVSIQLECTLTGISV